MITERARLTIKAGEEGAFEAAFARAIPLFLRADGCRGVRIERVIEAPETYVLVVDWERLEDHTVTFRNSDDFQEWRRLAGTHFAKPPEVEHMSPVLISPA